MRSIRTSIVAGALALACMAASAPASALPAGPLASVASDRSIAMPSAETVQYRRPYARHRYYGPRRGYYRGWRRGYRRGIPALPGRPIRRILRAL